MAELEAKKYLDYMGLTHYDEKIKAYIKTNGSDVTDALIALIGAAEKGEDEATILARIEALETAVGDVSELGDEVANLVKAILGEAARATEAEEGLQDAIDALDEKLYGSDTETEGETVHAKGDIDKIQDRLTALEENTDDADAIEELQKKLYGDADSEDDRKKAGDLKNLEEDLREYTDVAISTMNTEVTSENVAGITVEMAQTAGLITIPVLTVDDNQIIYNPDGEEGVVFEATDHSKVLKGDAINQIRAYIDDQNQEKAEAANERLEALEALHAKKTTGEGEGAKEEFKTVAEEVNEAVVALVDGAPEALDTLKEIADWIANQDESGVTDAATLVARVEENAQAIADEQERAEGAEADLQDAIDAVEAKVDAFTPITNDEIDALFAEEEKA